MHPEITQIICRICDPETFFDNYSLQIRPEIDVLFTPQHERIAAMRIKLPSLLLLLILAQGFATSVVAQIPNFCNGRPCIQVGTFNIEWFGTTNFDRHQPRSRATVKRIANLISNTLDLEVVVLEEINSESQEYEWLQEFLGARGYELHRVGTSGGEQGVAIAFDKDEVSLSSEGIREMEVRSEFDLGGGCVSRNLRLPIYGKFQAGQFDFVLVGVHLKSQLPVNDADDPAQCADDIRHAQSEDIVAALPEILTALNDQDVLIAGDFNATLNDASLSPLLANGGFISLTSGPRRAQGSNTISYLKAPFQEIIDHILIRQASTTEWATRSTFIFNPPSTPNLLRNYLRFTSDHAPAWSSFVTDGS